MAQGKTDRHAFPTGQPWWTANELLAFLLEVTAIVCLAWWGFARGQGELPALVLGLGAPAAAVLLWGLFAAPRARFDVPLAGVLVVKALVLGGAAVAVHDLGHPRAAALFAAVSLANTALAETFRHRHRHRHRRGPGPAPGPGPGPGDPGPGDPGLGNPHPGARPGSS
ncbi:YrdB family protein [uncultured Streptomyces sp.]|uniref:YrdB family protein n=1 Tax=uncultured Streptomyces sp. TaxID=174707 RepID=UPI00342B98AD